MKSIGFQIGIVCLAASAAACGGKATPAEPAEPAYATNESLPMEEQPDMQPAAVEAGPGEPTAAAEAEPMSPEPMKPDPVVAIADVKSVKDDAVIGAMTFELGDDGVITMAGQFTGLAPGKHAIYVYEYGDCASAGKNLGNHLDPTKAKHGPPSSSTRHAGDFGNVEADDSGAAMFSMQTNSVTLVADRPDSLLGRAVAIHAKPDDKRGKPGAVIACGVINLK